MGEILFRTRLSEDLFKGLAPWLNRLPGRLLHTNVIGCAIFAAVSGSSAATCATVGKMTIPELKRRGYPEDKVLGTLSGRSEEHTSELQSLLRTSYAVFCLKKKTTNNNTTNPQ